MRIYNLFDKQHLNINIIICKVKALIYALVSIPLYILCTYMFVTYLYSARMS